MVENILSLLLQGANGALRDQTLLELQAPVLFVQVCDSITDISLAQVVITEAN